MEIVYKTLGELTPYENNPRNNDEAVQYVKNSIEKFGFKVPSRNLDAKKTQLKKVLNGVT